MGGVTSLTRTTSQRACRAEGPIRGKRPNRTATHARIAATSVVSANHQSMRDLPLVLLDSLTFQDLVLQSAFLRFWFAGRFIQQLAHPLELRRGEVVALHECQDERCRVSTAELLCCFLEAAIQQVFP
jgi:hypothetical protein